MQSQNVVAAPFYGSSACFAVRDGIIFAIEMRGMRRLQIIEDIEERHSRTLGIKNVENPRPRESTQNLRLSALTQPDLMQGYRQPPLFPLLDHEQNSQFFDIALGDSPQPDRLKSPKHTNQQPFNRGKSDRKKSLDQISTALWSLREWKNILLCQLKIDSRKISLAKDSEERALTAFRTISTHSIVEVFVPSDLNEQECFVPHTRRNHSSRGP